MTADFQTILPPNSTQWEKAVERVSGERWDQLDPDVIRRFKDPWLCPFELLNFLAHELSVDIWDEDWDELKKRSVCAQSLENHSLKGTKEGHRRYLNIVDAELVETKTGPQGFFVGGPVNKQEWDAYIKRMPRVRISLETREGSWLPPDGVFLDHSFYGVDFLGVDRAHELLGRRAFFKAADAQEEIEVRLDEVGGDENGDGYERVTLPKRDEAGFYADEGYLDTDFLASGDPVQTVYSFRLNAGLNSEIDNLPLDSVGASLEPRSPRYERVSSQGEGHGGFFLDADFADDGCLSDDYAEALISDIIYFHDRDIAAPIIDTMGFVDIARLGFPAHTGEMLVRAEGTVLLHDGIFADQSFFDDDFVSTDDLKKLNASLDAICASKRFTDRLLVDFQTTKAPSLDLGLPLDQSTALDARVPASL
ncbi:phage tail protein I [Maritalea porphyrae]|uniref:phage tail protein I n=1 Tax=Maritalea porphyrae TaxID=880732 RepID=UPI0022AF8335|nr:phage tail protein I [Maritalea porphyrae]MCZ4273990.1 phage tail protein I [Maritalea porphyrae]